LALQAAGKEPSLTPGFLKDKLFELLGKALTPPAAFSAGAVVSLTLLLCSAGPYLVAIAAIGGTSLKTPLLIAYSIVFVLPLAVVLAVLSFIGAARKMKRSRRRICRGLGILVPVMLILLSIYLLLDSVSPSI